jgi:hypothetical protein
VLVDAEDHTLEAGRISEPPGSFDLDRVPAGVPAPAGSEHRLNSAYGLRGDRSGGRAITR